MNNRNRLWPMLIAGLLFSITIVWMGPLSQQIVERLWLKQGVTQTIGGSQTSVSFQGMILQKRALNSPDILPVYGSSEFSAISEFHPSRIFNGKPTGFIPFLVGRGGTQDLIQALNMAALGGSLKDKKVAVIVSAQWFTPEGITPVYFNQNFSPLHAYRMIFNSSLSGQTKTRLIERLLAFPDSFKEQPTLKALLIQQAVPGQKRNLQNINLELKGRVEMAALEVIDAAKTIRYSRLLSPADITTNATISAKELPSWLKLKDMAIIQGKAASQNNQFDIMDTYYSEYVLPNLASNRASASNAALYPSPEYQDLELLLQILQEGKAKPMFIIVPVNGAWYDYTGFPVKERNAYYARIEKMVRDKGFQVANFGDHEHDPYFLQDIMHLGWKGWVYVDEALDQFYHEGA
ncbi:D-alanyl-lipoteichoic acid biosynthesis protein DltD [Desulfosporosinus fructosivorans]